MDNSEPGSATDPKRLEAMRALSVELPQTHTEKPKLGERLRGWLEGLRGKKPAEQLEQIATKAVVEATPVQGTNVGTPPEQPQLLLIDGNRFRKYESIPHKTIIGGDGLYMSIAAASILAKTYRDEYMMKLDKNYPEYNWRSNKGYPTKEHYKGIEIAGISKYHRKTFNLNPQINLEFS